MSLCVQTNRRLAAVLLLALGVPLAAGCDEKAEEQTAEISTVRTLVVRRQVLSEFPSQVGEIRSHAESDLGFKIAGRILERKVDLGAIVRRGDILAQLDEQDQKNQLTAALADVTAARARLAQAESDAERQGKLRADGWATQAKLEDAIQGRDTARAALAAVEAKARAAGDQHGYAILRAPEDGAISAVSAEAGQVVAAGQMVVRLASLDKKDAVFTLSERALLTIPHDSVVEVRLLDSPQVVARGRVDQISPSADPITRTYTVKVALADPPSAMRLGMTVRGQLELASQPVVVLPVSALSQKDGQSAVWVVDPVRMTVDLAVVSVLRVEADRVLVASGLEDGAIVVTAGVQRLWPGRVVRLAAGASGAASGGALSAGAASGGALSAGESDGERAVRP